MFFDNPEYDGFVKKFERKQTTDDCFTPKHIYDAVADWVAAEWGVEKTRMVRPFWPGADFQKAEYPTDCVVVDNPPFSLFAYIIKWYQTHGIKFFLFGPALTLFSGVCDGVCYLPCGADVIYENGARVKTSFVTNLEKKYIIRSAPDLYQAIKAADDAARASEKRSLPKYDYPEEMITAAAAQQLSIHGVDFRVPAGEALFVRALDAQRKAGKAIFGGGFLLSAHAAAAHAAAHAAAAHAAAAHVDRECWELSARELEIVRRMSEAVRSDEEAKE